MSSPFTLIGSKVPLSLNRFEIQEIFGQYGKLYGTGLRFPSKKNDKRFFIDFQDKLGAVKAFKALNGKSHPKTDPGYKFELKLLNHPTIGLTNNPRLINKANKNSSSESFKLNETKLNNAQKDLNSNSAFSKISQDSRTSELSGSSLKHHAQGLHQNISLYETHENTTTKNAISQESNSTISALMKTKSLSTLKSSVNTQSTASHSDDIIDLLNFSDSIPNIIEDSSAVNVEIAKNLLNTSIGSFKLNLKTQFGSYLIPTLPQLGPLGAVVIDPTI